MLMTQRRSLSLAAMVFALGVISCSTDRPEPEPKADTGGTVVDLGKQMFFDKRLSGTGMMSCESCHLPEKGWTDGQVLSTKFDGSVNTRHTPTLYNVTQYKEGLYWDGRAATLEAQILAAWRNQMGGDPEKVAAAIDAIPEYHEKFTRLLGGPPNQERIVNALAAFVQTIESKDAPWDRYEANDRTAVSQDVVAGFELFSKKANCTLCHLPPAYSDTLFHNVGIGFDKPKPDLGRGGFLMTRLQGKGSPEEIANAKKLNGAFKTPTVRSITETAPYFHDGRAATLEEAVDLMLAGGIKNPDLDEKLKPAPLTPEERNQLLAFLRALTPEPKPFQRPTIP